MKNNWIIIFAILTGTTAFAQHERSVFSATGRAGVSTTFVTDYQTLGINPANLGLGPKYEDRHFAIGFFEWAHSVHSTALAKPELRTAIKDMISADNTNLTYDDKVNAAQDFADAGVSINADLSAISFAINTNKIGGFAFGVRERLQWYSRFNDKTSDILFRGFNADYFDKKITHAGDTIDINDPQYHPDSIQKAYNSAPMLFSDIMDGSRISMSWYREFNFGYGVKIFSIAKEEGEGDKIALLVGAGAKYLSGVGIIDINVKDGKFEAFSALSPIMGVEYDSLAIASNPSALGDNNGTLPNTVGSGMGFDFAATLVINEKFKVAIAVTDIGSMTWNGNVYVAHDTTLIDIRNGGFQNYNIFSQASDMMSDSGMFTWGGEVEQTISLPTAIRVGSSIAFTTEFEVGFDAIIPANEVSGSLNNALIAVGTDFKPLPWLKLSTGFSMGGNNGFNVPLGVIVEMNESGAWELGIATRDVLTYFLTNGPTISASFGFLRFRI